MADDKKSRNLQIAADVLKIFVAIASLLIPFVIALLRGDFTLEDVDRWIGARANELYMILVQPVTLSRWLLETLATGTLILFGIGLSKLYQRYREPTFHDYKGTEMFGVLWEWKWQERDGFPVITNPEPYCPECLGKLKSGYPKPLGGDPRKCRSCGFIKFLPPDAYKMVKQEVHRHIKLGEHVPRIEDYESKIKQIQEEVLDKASE